MHRFIPLLFLFPSQMPAVSLHKCIGDDGVPSYQSLPCGPGQRTAWKRRAAAPAAGVAVPVPVPTSAAPPLRRSVAATRTPGRVQAHDSSESRCATARRQADDLRDQQWNRLSFRQRSDLDAKVAKACAKP